MLNALRDRIDRLRRAVQERYGATPEPQPRLVAALHRLLAHRAALPYSCEAMRSALDEIEHEAAELYASGRMHEQAYAVWGGLIRAAAMELATAEVMRTRLN